MRKALLLLMLLGLPASARASWAHIPVEELVQDSDLVVVGTLRDVRERTAGGTDYGEGLIHVREVIWGRVSPGDSLRLRWYNPSTILCPRVEHKYNAGEEGVWLLTLDGGAVAADYPGRFVELSARAEVEAALRRTPVVLRTASYWVGRGEPLRFSVVYRNASSGPRSFPGVAFEGGRLRLPAGSRFGVMLRGGEEPLDALARGPVLYERGLAPVTVGPRAEHRVEVVLGDLLKQAPKEGDLYSVRLRLPGLRPTNVVNLYRGTPDVQRPAAEAPPAPAVDCVYTFSAPVRHRLSAPARAGLAALAAVLLFPVFQRLRAALTAARLARVTHGAQTWQI